MPRLIMIMQGMFIYAWYKVNCFLMQDPVEDWSEGYLRWS